MNSARTLRLLVGREVMDRLRNRVYVLGTLILAVVLVGAILIPGLLADDAPEQFDLGLVGAVPDAFAASLEVNAAGHGIEVTLIEYGHRDAAAAAVRDGEVDAALLDGQEMMADGAPDMALRTAVETALHQVETAARLESAGVAADQRAAVLAPREPLTVVDPSGEEGTDAFAGHLVAFAATLLLFGAVTANGSSLLTGAVEEKSSRVIEVLLGSVRPWQLLTAKIVALTGLALAQVGLFAGAALGANAVAGTFDFPPATTSTIVAALVMILVGFVFYAALYTVAGSLAPTTEDAQGSAGPLGFAIMGAYFLVVFVVLPSPHGAWAHVMTYLPPTAPFTVPARVALDAIPLWQAALATGATLLGVALTVALATRLYAASLLAGGKLTWREAWRSEPIR